MTTEGMEYRGSASTSRSGIPCQAWNMQSPHTHDMMPSNHPDKGLNENYCRNPDNEENGPWCYTTSVNKRWEHCDIQKCETLILDKLMRLKLPTPSLLIPLDKSLIELIFHRTYVYRITQMKNQGVLDIYGHPINYGYIKDNATTAINLEGTDLLFSIYGGFTMSIHVRPDTLVESAILSFVNASSYQQMAISTHADGAITVSAQLEGDKTITLRTSSILEALKWNIIAVVFNVQEGVMEIYNNGKKVAEELTGNSIPTINAAKGIIGTSFQEYFDSAGQTANTFKGYVACFQVYDRCLRSHEVKVTMMCLNQHSAVRCKETCKGDGVCDQITGKCLCPPDANRHVNSDCSNALQNTTYKEAEVYISFHSHKELDTNVKVENSTELITDVQAENSIQVSNRSYSSLSRSQSCKHSYAYLTQGAVNLGMCTKTRSPVSIYDSLSKLKSNSSILSSTFTLSVWVYIPPTTEWNNETTVTIMKMNSLKISAKFGNASLSNSPLDHVVYGSLLLEIVHSSISQQCSWHIRAVAGAWIHLTVISNGSLGIYYNGYPAFFDQYFCNSSETEPAFFREIYITIGGNVSGICIDELAVWNYQVASHNITRMYTTGSNAGNVAFQKSTRQSSSYSGEFRPSSLAVDGNTNPDYIQGSCSTTEEEDDPWWMVDLGIEYPVERVLVTSRGDCCVDRIQGFEVRIGNSDQTGGIQNSVCQSNQTIGSGETKTIRCNYYLNGRYVTIRLPNKRALLTLCEVQVFIRSGESGVLDGPNGLAKVEINVKFHVARFKWVDEFRDLENLDRLRIVGNIRTKINEIFANIYTSVTTEYGDISWWLLNVTRIQEFCGCSSISSPDVTFHHCMSSISDGREGTWTNTYQEVTLNAWLGFSYISKSVMDLLSTDTFKDTQMTCVHSHCFFSLTGNVIGVPYFPPVVTVLQSMSRNITLKYSTPRKNVGVAHYGYMYKLSGSSRLANDPRIHSRVETMVHAGVVWQLQNLKPYMTYTMTLYAASHQGLSMPKEHTIQTSAEEPEEAPGNLRCQATSQTQIEVRFRQIPIGKWNGVPNGYNVFYKSLLQLEDKESFLVENFNSTSTNAHSTTDSSTEYTVTISELEIFTNYSLVVGAYNNEGVGKLARVYCRTHEGVPERSPTNISAITVNSTHLNISFAFLPEDIEVWNSFELKNYHLSVTEIFLPQFIKETMNRTIPKNISQVIFGPIEEDREYSIWIAGVTQLGLGVKSEKVCIRTHQATPSQMPMEFRVWNESSTELRLRVGNVTHQHENGLILYYNISVAEAHMMQSENVTVVGNTTLSENITVAVEASITFEYKMINVMPSVIDDCVASQSMSNEAVANYTLFSNHTTLNCSLSNHTTTNCSLLNHTTTYCPIQWVIPKGNNSYGTHKCTWNMTTSQTSFAKEYLIDNLKYYTLHILRASACTSVGCGPQTSPFLVQTDEHTPTCSPINMMVSNISSTSLLVQWTRTPENCTHGIITMYTLYIGESGAFQNANISHLHQNIALLRNMSTVKTVSFPTDETTFDGLRKFLNYCVLIQAHTSKGAGPLSPLHCAYTAEDVPDGPPRNVSCTADTSTSFECTIIPPSRTVVNGIIRGYILYLHETNSNCDRLGEEFNITFERRVSSDFALTNDATLGMISQLKKFTFYAIQAVAYTSVGSAERRPGCYLSRTLEDVPSAGPRNVSIFNVSSTCFTVCWRPIKTEFIHGIMQNFQLNISETLNDDTQGIFVTVHEPVSTGGKNISAENSSIAAEGSNAGPYCSSFKGLRPYTRYNVYISGCTNPGCGAISESYTRTTEEAPSGPVEMLVGYNSSSTSVTIEWNPPDALQQNGIITSYHVQWRKICTNYSTDTVHSTIDVIYIPACNSSRSEVINSADTANTTFLINGLLPFTYYEIKVIANTSEGGGPSVSVITMTDQDVPEESPDNITGHDTNGHSIQIKWNQIPLRFRNSYLLGYYIFYKKVNSTEPEQYFTCSANGYLLTTCEITTLEFHTAYEMSVAGFSSKGAGKRSEIIVISTGRFVHGNWSQWSFWSFCSQSCGGGQQDRSRSCTEPSPWNGGLDCVGDSKESIICGTRPCSGYYLGRYNEDCNEACLAYNLSCNPQIVTADNRDDYNVFIKERCRTDESYANHTEEYHPVYLNSTGVCKGYTHMPEWVRCNVRPPDDGKTQRLCSCVDQGDIGFESWTEWSLCSVSCGGGSIKRTRECVSPFGCKGPTTEDRDCNRHSCPVDGNWGEWSTWSDCNQTCGYGYQNRRRLCNNPSPAHGGENCTGPSVDTEGECNPLPCPIHGEWGPWGSWKSCNQACGTGTQRRNRYCDSPSPWYGGRYCTGNDIEYTPCTLQPCEGQECRFVYKLRDFVWKICYYYLNSECSQELSNSLLASLDNVFLGNVVTEGAQVNEFSRGSVIANFSIFYSAVKNTEILYLQDVVQITGNISNLAVTPVGIEFPAIITSPPANLTATGLNGTSINLTWTPPSKIELVPNISKYFIFYRPADSQVGLWEMNGAVIGSKSHAITDLKPATEYRIRMTISLTTGNGPASGEVTAKTPDGIPDVPPSNLKLMSIKASEVFLEWTPIPMANVNGILKGYKVKYKKYFNSEYEVVYTKGQTSEKTVTGLKGFTLYMFEISAFTTTGEGPPVPGVIKTLEGVPEVAPLVSVKDLMSIDCLLVEWQKIPDDKVNGRLLGYRIRYTTYQIGTKYVLGESDTKTIDVDKFTFSLKITGLQSFTKYTVTVSGFNQPGEGPQSNPILASTCRCPENLINNWYENRPYVMKDSKRHVSGLFPSIIRDALKMSCGVCNDNKERKIYFFRSKDGENAQKKSERKLIDSISDQFHVHFPVFGQFDKSIYMEKFVFVSVVKSSGSAMIVRNEHVLGAKTTAVLNSVIGVWPVLVITFCITVLVGILIWFTEQYQNSEEFATGKFGVGVLQGMWWAFVSMTTVGYGDISPRSFSGRLVSMAWTLTGLVLTGIVTGAITSALTTLTVPPDVILYGTKVAAINDSFEYRLGVMRNGRVNQEKSYETVNEVLSALQSGEVDAALLDAFVAASHQKTLDAKHLKVKKFIDANSGYGLVLSGEMVRLESDFRSQVIASQDFVSQFVANMTAKLQASTEVLEEPRLFDPNSSEFWVMLKYELILLGILTVLGLSWWMKFRYAKKRSTVRPHKDMLKTLQDEMNPLVNDFTTSTEEKIYRVSQSQLDQVMELSRLKKSYRRHVKRRLSVNSQLDQSSRTGSRALKYNKTLKCNKNSEKYIVT